MDWIKVSGKDLRRLGEVRKLPIKGVNLEVRVSPYQIPIGVKGEYNRERHLFEIRFQYLDEETPKIRKIDEHLSALEGVNSGRLLGIDIDVDRLGVDAVALILQGLEKKLEPKEASKRNIPGPAWRVLDTNKDQLLASLCIG
ncbi:MAG: hypothetical protein WC869_08385 [Phycisphaerae bacterium]|jgi:hypothetical protein